jgi:fatty-acyl-CoA synthase
VHGTAGQALRGETVGECLRAAAARWPDRTALVVPYQDVRWTYSDLDQRVDAVAAGLVALGLSPGDRLGIWAPNRAEWVLAQFASARAGLVLVNLNPAWREAEVERALGLVWVRALVTAQSFKDSDYVGMLRRLCPELEAAAGGELHAARLPALRRVVCLGEEAPAGTLAFDHLAGAAGPAQAVRLRALEDQLQFDDPINIQFTSGTTGAPKAATLTHHSIVNNAWLVGERMGFTPDDRLCIPVPMYHCFGMVLGTLACAAHGATMVFSSASFDPGALLRTVASERCTALHGVPTMFIAALEQPDFAHHDLSSLRTGVMAGAPCPEELMRRVMRDMHLDEITIAYGMTETGPVSFQTAVDDTLEHRVSTVGRVLPHTEVKIVDSAGRIVPRGEVGELLTRGYCVMRGYWDDAERTAEAIDEAGWISSGDLAAIDSDGYCRIVGRLKDMLIRGGENIYPREIEEVLYTHPAVEEAEVFGVPDARYGEEICAWLKLRPRATTTAEEIGAFCASRMSHFKVPRYVRFVDAFPMTVTGKVRKHLMRERMTAELGEPDQEVAST